MAERRGMLGLFGAGRVPGAIPLDQDGVDELVREGFLEIHDPGPPPRYRLSEDGLVYVEQELFPSLGVTPDEAIAWMEERFG